MFDNLDWSSKKILVAEDVESNYLFIEAVLRKTKAQLVWVQTGREALDYVRNNDDLDLILMDIQMPEMNGYEATREIKKLDKDLPVVAQTAYAMSGEKELSIQAGCDGYIAKPIRVQTLLEVIKDLLG